MPTDPVHRYCRPHRPRVQSKSAPGDLPLAFWRTSSGFEVDLIVGNLDLAIECKSAPEVRSADLEGLRAFKEEHAPRRSLVVSRVRERKLTEDGIEIVPWREFCEDLWAGRHLAPSVMLAQAPGREDPTP